MDVEAAGPGLVAGVAHGPGGGQHLRPWHFPEVVVQGHGIGHQFEAVVQGAVVLAVEPPLPPVGDVQQLPGVGAVLPRSIDLQLHAEKPGALPVKNGGWFEGVVVNICAAVQLFPASAAVGVLSLQIEGLIFRDQAAAAGAAGVAAVEAPRAQGGAVVSGVVLPPDPVAAVDADHRVLLQAAAAEMAAVKGDEPALSGDAAAGVANLLHRDHLTKKIARRRTHRASWR